MRQVYLFFARKRAQLRSWFRAATQRERLEVEMEIELAVHLENLTADRCVPVFRPQRPNAARALRLAQP